MSSAGASSSEDTADNGPSVPASYYEDPINLREISDALALAAAKLLKSPDGIVLGDDAEAAALVAESPPMPTSALDAPLLIRPGGVIRCGKVDYVPWEKLGSPKLVLNLRRHSDSFHSTLVDQKVKKLRVSASNNCENYHVVNKEVLVWLADSLKPFADPESYPIVVHCHHGRDRTGIVVAALLFILDCPIDLVIADFMGSHEAPLGMFLETLTQWGFEVPDRWKALAASTGSSSKTSRPTVAGKEKGKWVDKRKKTPPPASSASSAAAVRPSELMQRYFSGRVDIEKIRSLMLLDGGGSS